MMCAGSDENKAPNSFIYMYIYIKKNKRVCSNDRLENGLMYISQDFEFKLTKFIPQFKNLELKCKP